MSSQVNIDEDEDDREDDLPKQEEAELHEEENLLSSNE